MKGNAQKIILASASARRIQILTELGVEFTSQAADIDESVNDNEACSDYVSRLALQKCQKIFDLTAANTVVLGSDTSVVIDQKILGKPESQEHAVEMLMSLSGRWHQVFTAVSVLDANQHLSKLVVTQVEFCKLDEALCRRYWETEEPLGKAGSYAIQGKGARFVRQIKGSYSAVVGLPVMETAQLLMSFDIPIWNFTKDS